MDMMDMKYIKLKSLTWWAAFTPFILGVFVAAEPVHGLTEYVQVVNSMTGDLSAAVLINAGLFGIGLRGVR